MKQVDKHAHGALVTKTPVSLYHKPCSKRVRDRIKRWAKRVLKREAEVQSRDE